MRFFFLLPLLIIIPSAYADITLENVDFEFDDFNLNVTDAVTVEQFNHQALNFSSRNSTSNELREYSFDNAVAVFDVRWEIMNTTAAQFTVTDVVTGVEGNVTGTILYDVELDDISVSWTYSTWNIVDIDTADKVLYTFNAPPVPPVPPTFEAILLQVNHPTSTRLGGVFSGVCDFANNYTMIGIWQNGTIRCLQWSTGPAP